MIGIVGIDPAVYWRLTPAETAAIANGYNYNNQVQASFHRATFTLTHNIWAGKGKQRKEYQLWPLPLIDRKPDKMKFEDRIKWYQAVLENSRN